MIFAKHSMSYKQKATILKYNMETKENSTEGYIYIMNHSITMARMYSKSEELVMLSNDYTNIIHLISVNPS